MAFDGNLKNEPLDWALRGSVRPTTPDWNSLHALMASGGRLVRKTKKADFNQQKHMVHLHAIGPEVEIN